MYFDVYFKINNQTLRLHIPVKIVCLSNLFIWKINKISRYKIALQLFRQQFYQDRPAFISAFVWAINVKRISLQLF